MSNYKIITKDDELKHYGVKGMKWHKRKARGNAMEMRIGRNDADVSRRRQALRDARARSVNGGSLSTNAMERRIATGGATISKTNQGIRDRRQRLHENRKKEYVGYRIKSDIKSAKGTMKSYQKKAKKIIPSIKKSFNKTVSSLKTKAKTIKRRFLSGLLF